MNIDKDKDIRKNNIKNCDLYFYITTMNHIYVFWTGTNEMPENRVRCLEQLKTVSESDVILVTRQNLNDYILQSEPLHPAYFYLSETHRADYLRTYFMNFHGGGYSDIKETTGSWKSCFIELYNSDKWINGYKEIDGGVAYPPAAEYWREMVGNGAYICKPQTPLTKEWYNDMISLLDSKLDQLKLYPSTFPQDCAEVSSGKYPIAWNEMLGRIFHRISYKYKDHVLNTLPISVFYNYR